MFYLDNMFLSAGKSSDCNANGTRDDCEALGDFDLDCDVDLRDLGGLQTCFSGPDGANISFRCRVFDSDTNRTIDLEDFSVFYDAFSGPAP